MPPCPLWHHYWFFFFFFFLRCSSSNCGMCSTSWEVMTLKHVEQWCLFGLGLCLWTVFSPSWLNQEVKLRIPGCLGPYNSIMSFPSMLWFWTRIWKVKITKYFIVSKSACHSDVFYLFLLFWINFIFFQSSESVNESKNSFNNFKKKILQIILQLSMFHFYCFILYAWSTRRLLSSC